MGSKGHELPLDHVAWDIEAYYIAQGLVNFILTLSPEKINFRWWSNETISTFPKN